jgi:hypothetical protein
MQNEFRRHSRSYGVLLGLSLALAGGQTAQAEDLPADLQAKVDAYKDKLVRWAADPVLIAAVKASNAKGGLAPGMSNAKWVELSESDPLVKATQGGEAGALLASWAQDTAISKLYLRDKDGNLVAGDSKAILYNSAKKPTFANAIKGAPWSASEVKPDPTSQVNGVHLSVPVLDGATPIGVLHTSVVAK